MVNLTPIIIRILYVFSLPKTCKSHLDFYCDRNITLVKNCNISPIFLRDVLVFARCQIKICQLHVEHESLWAGQYSFTTYCEEAPLCTVLYTTRIMNCVDFKWFTYFPRIWKVSIYFGTYVHDLKAFDTSISSFSTVWKMLLLLAMLILLPYQNICLQYNNETCCSLSTVLLVRVLWRLHGLRFLGSGDLALPTVKWLVLSCIYCCLQ